MSLKNAQAFLKEAEDNVALREKWEAATGNSAALVALGAEYEFDFTTDELNQAMDELDDNLSDDEMENTAGGGGPRPLRNLD